MYVEGFTHESQCRFLACRESWDRVCGRRILISRSEVMTRSIAIPSFKCPRVLTNEFSIGHYLWVELDPQSLCVVRGTRANFSIIRIIGVSSGIPYGGLEDSLVLGRRVVLQEYVFNPPEASSCKCGDFGCDFS